MRLIIHRTPDDTFIQGEWQDSAGFHTRRITEDLDPELLAVLGDFLDNTDALEEIVLAPLAEKMGEISRIEQEIGKLQTRLKELKG